MVVFVLFREVSLSSLDVLSVCLLHRLHYLPRPAPSPSLSPALLSESEKPHPNSDDPVQLPRCPLLTDGSQKDAKCLQLLCLLLTHIIVSSVLFPSPCPAPTWTKSPRHGRVASLSQGGLHSGQWLRVLFVMSALLSLRDGRYSLSLRQGR